MAFVLAKQRESNVVSEHCLRLYMKKEELQI